MSNKKAVLNAQRSLDRERQILLSGKLSDLPEVAEEISGIFSQIEESPNLSSNDLESIRARVKRNQNLLKSSMKGIEDAATRIKDLREARFSLKTYAASGKNQNLLLVHQHSIEKRA